MKVAVNRKAPAAYTLARIRARKSKLLKRTDYEKLLKMDIYTMLKTLEEIGYHLENIELANPFEAIEEAITRALEREFAELQSFVSGKRKEVLEAYLKRFDVENAKLILRSRARGVNIDSSLFFAAGKLSREKLTELANAEIDQLIKTLSLPLKRGEMKALISAWEKGRIEEVENLIDRAYYRMLSQKIKSLRGREKILRHFVELRLDVMNTRVVLRAKTMKLRKDELKDLLLPCGRINKRELYSLFEAGFEKIQETFAKKWGIYIEKKPKSTGEFEKILEEHMLKFAEKLMHTSPFSAAPIIAYVLMREAEARNIRMIARAKYYAVAEEEVRKSLVIWE